MPAAVFFCAWQASQSQSDPDVAWVAASIVGVAAVVSGTVLAAIHLLRRDRTAGSANGHPAKSQFDADAYDVVSSRG